MDPIYPFYFSFNSMPHSLTKKCLANAVDSRTKLAASLGHKPILFRKLADRLKGSMSLSLMTQNRVGFQAVTWDGERIALQFVRNETEANSATDLTLNMVGIVNI